MGLFSSSRPGLTGRVLSKFPARLRGINGDKLSLSGGVATAEPDYAALVASGAIDPADQLSTYLRILKQDGTYAKFPFGLFPSNRVKATSNYNIYVRTDGNNNNTGSTNTSGGAFLTPQKAWDHTQANIDPA